LDQVQKYYQKKWKTQLRPEGSPKVETVFRVQEAAGKVLRAHKWTDSATGFSSIIQDQASWLAMTKGTAREETTFTTPPVWYPRLDPATSSGAQLSAWKNNNEEYNLYWTLNDGVIDVYKWAFPDNWNSLEPADDMPIAGIAAREYHNHLLDVIRNSMRKDMTNARIHEELRKLRYEPNANGPNLFFSRAKEWKHTSIAIEPKSAVNDAMLMEYCDLAFRRSGHGKHLLAGVDQLWAQEADKEWEDYQTFYTKELAKLFNDGDTGTTTTKENAEIAELKERLAIAEGNIEQVNDDPSQEQACSAIDIGAAIAQAVKTALAEERSNNGGGGGGGGGANGNNTNNEQRGPREKWSQFDHYCSSRGVNTTCNGSSCNRYCKKGPNHDPTATFANRKGGSEKGVWKWMKWRGPDGRAYDIRGDETSLSTPPPA